MKPWYFVWIDELESFSLPFWVCWRIFRICYSADCPDNPKQCTVVQCTILFYNTELFSTVHFFTVQCRVVHKVESCTVHCSVVQSNTDMYNWIVYSGNWEIDWILLILAWPPANSLDYVEVYSFIHRLRIPLRAQFSQSIIPHKPWVRSARTEAHIGTRAHMKTPLYCPSHHIQCWTDPS